MCVVTHRLRTALESGAKNRVIFRCTKTLRANKNLLHWVHLPGFTLCLLGTAPPFRSQGYSILEKVYFQPLTSHTN